MRFFRIAHLHRISSGVSTVGHVGIFFHHYNRQQVAGMMLCAKQPAFRKAREDGSDEEIEEEELYRYTRFRWLCVLCDEPEKQDSRYRKFNIQALLEVAVMAVGNGATSCVKVLKCIEGQFNKAILLTMDNDVEVFAKLPNPNAGPEWFTTASEVATRYFMREALGVPTPRILASSFDSFNAVGAEYIIEETTRGEPLGSLWNQWSMESRLDFVSQIVDFERRLTSVSFPKHGCIYYKADLESCNRSILDRFAMGPLTEGRLWEAERAKMPLDRGPWTSTLAYLNALGTNEIQWVKSYARPRMNFHRSMKSPEIPDDFLSLLTRYIKLAPYLVPKPSEETCLKTLSHPDLHLDNIFVDPTTREITNIIDWQSTSVSEGFLHRTIPPMLSHLDQQYSESGEGQSQDLVSHYKHLTETRNPQHWAVLKDDHISILTKPASLLCGAWNREDVFSFRHALITVVAHWKQIVPDSTPCPVQFTELELELHGKEMELIEGLGTIMHQLQEENIIPLGGMVRPEHYEQAQCANNRFKEMFISLAENEQQRALHSKVWPYQDKVC